MDLTDLRRAIDAVDDDLLRLLNERARLVKEVGKAKEAHNKPFYVPDRERQIVERLKELNVAQGAAFPTDAVQPVFSEIISACLSLEKPLRVAYLGPEATFTHQAARARFGLSARYVPAATIAQVFAEVDKGLADLAVVPIENSTEGVVTSTLDMFMESDLRISAEVVLEVNQCLLTRTGVLEGIDKVYSHPQALGQCRAWLHANLPRAALIEVASTALAARLARDEPSAAAVASELAGQLYDLRIAKAKIEDQTGNATRFLVVSRAGAAQMEATGNDKTSVMLSVRDQPGLLFRVLRPFADRGINLTRIESRPSRRRAWDYVFFLDLDGHFSDPRVKDALLALETACEQVKVLGSYPRADAPVRPER